MAVEELKDGGGEAIKDFNVQFISSVGFGFFHNTRRVRSGWYV